MGSDDIDDPLSDERGAGVSESDSPETCLHEVESGAARPDESTSVEVLRTTREESRTVLDRKLERLDEIDDKAMRTVRTAVILLGLLISAGGIAGPQRLEDIGFYPSLFSAIGASLLFVAVVLGIFSYTVSENREGIGRSFRNEARTASYDESEWLLLLLQGYDEWIGRMSEINDRNKTQLTIVQGSLVCGLLSLGMALGISLWPNDIVAYAVAFLVIFLGSVALFVRGT